MSNEPIATLDISRATPEIWAAVAKAQADVESVGKDGKNTQRGYRYATTEAMIRGSRQHLAQHGLAFVSTWSQSLPEVATGDIGKQHVAARVTIHWVLGHEGGGCLTGQAHMDAIGSPARPPDKAVAAAVTYGLGFVLRGLLLLDRSEEDEHAPDRRPEPEPDRLWMAYEAQRSKAAQHLRITAPQAHQRILAVAEVRADRDPDDREVQRMIEVAEAMLLTDPEPVPTEQERAAKNAANEPAKSRKGKPKATENAEPQGIVATRAAFQSAFKAYQEECAAQGETPLPWRQLASRAIGGKPWPDQPGTDEYLKAANVCEQEIERMRGGEG